MILALVDHDRGRLDELALEALSFGRRLAERLELPLHAVLIGSSARDLTGAVGAYGASSIHLVVDDRLVEYAPEAWAESVVQLAATTRPQAILAPGSTRGAEVMAHVAARSDLPLAANCVGVVPGDPYIVTRWRWGGSLLEEAELTGSVKLLTVAPHALRAEEAPEADPPALELFSPALTDREFRVMITERVDRPAGKVSLAQARVVVGGGRGLASAEAFAPLEELAAMLGGAVGCSRAVTSAGWRPHTDQIGQTGVRIAPDLYIACGISGATQHIVGCKGAKHILAVNTDPEAPILARADYAVIGDARQVIPALIDEIRRSRGT